jgi:hypothetical protein
VGKLKFCEPAEPQLVAVGAHYLFRLYTLGQRIRTLVP